MLKGKKTYILAVATALYAIGGWYTGALTVQEAAEILLPVLGLATVRHGISTEISA